MNKNNSHKNYSFSKDRLFKYVETFSFPRLSGTKGEKKAVDLTVKTFKENKFDENNIQKEDFEFSDFYSTTLIQMIAIISLTTTLTLVLTLYIDPIISVLIIALMVIIVSLILKGLKHPEKAGFWGKYYGNTIQSSNVFVKIPAKSLSEKEAGNIVISAHLDSKSQTFKTFWRVLIYKIWLYSGIILGITYLISLIYYVSKRYVTFIYFFLPSIENGVLILNITLLVFTVLISIANISLMFLNTRNKSPGALDNATGMAIVFELSSYFKNHELDNFNLWFCQFSAEELGTMGSRVFVNKYEDQFIKGKIFQINVDMVSATGHQGNIVEYLKSYGVLFRKKIAPILSNYLELAAKEEKIKIQGFHLSTGAHTDCVPFHLRGYNAIVISTRAAARYTHSKEDTPDKVDPQVLLEACIIIRKAILMLNKDYKFYFEN